MKMVKSLLLGIAAGMLAMSGAQAADLPVKAKPVHYVKVSSIETIIDGGTVLKQTVSCCVDFILPIKGDKNAEIVIFQPFLVAEGNGDIDGAGLGINPGGGVGGLYPDTQEGDSACHLKPEYRISLNAGVGISDPDHGIDYDHGA